MNRIVKLLTILLLFVHMSVCAQEPQQETLKPDDILNRVKTLDAEIGQIQALTERIAEAETFEHDALVYRRDALGFKFLQDFDALVSRLPAIPDTAPYKADLSAKLTDLSEKASAAIFDRISEIGQRIARADKVLASSSGKDYVENLAYFQSLEDMRARYYEKLLNLVKNRRTLGLESEDLRTRLGSEASLYAQALAGRIQVISTIRAQIQERAKQSPDNADMKAALLDLDVRHKRNLRRLESIVPVLDGLGIESSSYKTLLLQQAGVISVSHFSTRAFYAVLEEGWTKVVHILKSSGPDLLVSLLVFVAVLFVSRLLSQLTRRLVRAASDRSSLPMSNLLKNMLVSISGGGVMLVGLLIALSYIGISLTPMLAGLGVAGFIVGFALQDSLSNFAAGAMILIYRPYDVNDFIEVTGVSGLVKKMNLVSTTVVTFDNQTLVVPNSKIWGDVIKNVTAQKQRRVDLQFGIGYGDDIELAEKIFREIVESHDKVLTDPEPTIRLHSLGDSSVNFIVRPWTRTEDYWSVYWDITREVKLRLEQEGISIPFPQRDVHLYTQTES